MEDLIELIKEKYCPNATEDDVLNAVLSLDVEPDNLTIKQAKEVAIEVRALVEKREEQAAVPQLKTEVSTLKAEVELLKSCLTSLTDKHDEFLEKFEALALEIEILSSAPTPKTIEVEGQDEEGNNWNDFFCAPKSAHSPNGEELWKVTMESFDPSQLATGYPGGWGKDGAD